MLRVRLAPCSLAVRHLRGMLVSVLWRIAGDENGREAKEELTVRTCVHGLLFSSVLDKKRPSQERMYRSRTMSHGTWDMAPHVRRSMFAWLSGS